MVNTQLFGIPEGSERLALRCDVEPVDLYQLHRGTPFGRVRVGSVEVVLKHRQCVDVRHLKNKTKQCIIHEEINLKQSIKITTQHKLNTGLHFKRQQKPVWEDSKLHLERQHSILRALEIIEISNNNNTFLGEICTMAHCKIKETNNYAIHNQGNWLSFFFFSLKR